MDEINLLDYARILTRRKWTIVSATLIVLLMAGIFLMVSARTYEGRTVLLFPQQKGDVLSSQLLNLAGLPMVSGLMPGLSGRDVYVAVLKSRTISKSVLRSLELDKLDLDFDDLQNCMVIETPKDGSLIVTCQVPTSWLKGSVPPDELKEQTSVLAAKVANAYIEELSEYDKSSTLFMGKKHRVFVESELERIREEVASAEGRLQTFQQKNPTLVPPQSSSLYSEQALKIAVQQAETDVALNEAKGQLARAQTAWDAGAPSGVSPELVADSPAISELRSNLARLEVRRATLLENFTERHPDVVAVTQEIDKTYEKVNQEIALVLSGQDARVSTADQELLKQLVALEVSRDGLSARKIALAGTLSNLENRLSTLPPKEIEYARLLRDVKVAETVYTTMMGEHAKAVVAEGRDTDNFIVLDEAVPQELPAKPRVKLTLAAAFMLGMMLGIMIATMQGPSAKK